MRTLTIAVLAVSALSMPGAAVVPAQEPSPGLASAGQRVEVPEEAYAVTFPDGWEVGTYPMELGSDSPDGTSTEAVYMSAYGWVPDGSTQCLISIEPLTDPPGDPLMALERSSGWVSAHYEPFLIETSTLELPAGPAIHYAIESEGNVGSGYLFSDGFDRFFLTCLGADPPDDRWLSIAETFEFLPEEE